MRLWPIILLILCGCAMTTRREAKRADESDANAAALAMRSLERDQKIAVCQRDGGGGATV